MDEAVDRRDGHGGIGEDGIPGAERLVGGDEDRATLVPCADQLEQHAGLGLAFLDVGEVVEDQQAVFVELLDGGGESQFLTCGLVLRNAADRLSERCSAGAPPRIESAAARPAASAV